MLGNLNHLNVVLLGGGSEHASTIFEWEAVQSLSSCSHVTAAEIPIFHFKESNVLCDMDIISETELCIRRKLLLGGLYFQLFICYSLGLDLSQGPKNIIKWRFRALSRVRKAVIRIIQQTLHGGYTARVISAALAVTAPHTLGGSSRPSCV